jgi:hypothetical protein
VIVRDLIKASLRKLGVLASGEEPSASEAQDALTALNAMIASWRTQSLIAYAVLPEDFAFVAGQKSYTMGPGGDWDTVRPIRVEKVQMTYTTDSPQPLNLGITMIDLDQYQNLVVPDTTSTIPQFVYVDDNFPLRRLFFYTVPQNVYPVQVFSWRSITQFPDINTTISLLDGYERALTFNLALEIAAEYGAEAVAAAGLIANQAIEAKAVIMSLNNRTGLLTCDPAIVSSDMGGWNYLTGGFGTSGSN